MPAPIGSTAAVTRVSRDDFWLHLGDEELLVPFAELSWFREATVARLLGLHPKS